MINNLYCYKAKVVNLVDADTMDMEVDLGFGLKMTQRFRVENFDAPETWRPRNEAERIHGTEATKRATELLVDKPLLIRSSKVPGIYGRYGVTIWLEDGRNFAEVMISENFQKEEQY